MQMMAHYIRLRNSVVHHPIGEPLSITVEELSLALCCTPRNAKLIVKRLEDERWITWNPGRGRGNRSAITFCIHPEELVMRHAKAKMLSGQIRQARELIEQFVQELPQLADSFHFWLKTQFGYHTDPQETGQIDTLRLSFFRPLLSLDPAHYWMRSEGHIIKQVCDTLVRFRPETKRIEPHLAHAWEVNQENTIWTFYLRKGVQFHNGRRLSTHDVKYTFERYMPQSHPPVTPYRWLMEAVREIVVINELTIQLKLKHPHTLLLELLTNERLSILPSGLLTDQEPNHVPTMLIGTGPFKLSRNDQSMFVLEAFDSYFRERAHLDRIEWWVIPEWEENSGDSGTWKTDVSVEYGMDGDSGRSTQGPEPVRTQHLEKNVTFLSLNQEKTGPMQDPRFREAMARIINQAQMVKELGGSRHEPAFGLFQVTTGIKEASSVPIEQLIEESYHGEILRLHTFEDADHREDAAWIKHRCARYGIHVEPYYYEPQTMMEVDNIREADFIHDSATIDELWEISFLEMLATDNSFVKLHLSQELSPFIQSQIKQLLSCYSSGERLQVFQLMEARLLTEQAVIPLYRNQLQVVARPELRDVTVNAQGWLEHRLLWFRPSERNDENG